MSLYYATKTTLNFRIYGLAQYNDSRPVVITHSHKARLSGYRYVAQVVYSGAGVANEYAVLRTNLQHKCMITRLICRHLHM